MFTIDSTTQKVLKRYPHRVDDIVQSFDKKQIESKLWLSSQFNKLWTKKLIPTPKVERVNIIGGWYGHQIIPIVREVLEQVPIIFHEIDNEAIDICKNYYFPNDHDIKYRHEDATKKEFTGNKRLVICTSCEHMQPLNIKSGLVILQSNNYVSIEEHTNCVESLDEFKSQYNFKKMFYEGQLHFTDYTRYMLIGRI